MITKLYCFCSFYLETKNVFNDKKSCKYYLIENLEIYSENEKTDIGNGN